MSARGGEASWQQRLQIRGDGPLAAPLEVLRETIDQLGQPGLSVEEIARLRARTYAASVAARVVEVAELDSLVHELNHRLELVEGPYRRTA